MAADGSSGRSSWFVPVLVALITALGAIGVAIISAQDDDGQAAAPKTAAPEQQSPAPHEDSTEPEPDETSGTESAVPRIDGEYNLDPGNSRIILVEDIGDDRFSIQEQLPADWPFYGVLEWTSEGQFEGLANFASGVRMKVVVEPMPDGRLLTEFQFITDAQGVTIDRVDKHVLVPVE